MSGDLSSILSGIVGLSIALAAAVGLAACGRASRSSGSVECDVSRVSR